ncbi:hypothetical protein D3C76_130710 [compost metagenome]
MAPRIQFRISDSEYESLDREARIQGYPDVVSYAKDLVLSTIKGTNPKASVKMIDLYKLAEGKIIEEIQSGSIFTIKDLIPNPPALLGKLILKGVENQVIENVVLLPDLDTNGALQYLKTEDTSDNSES